MSIEVLQISCDNCNFASSDLSTWGIWEYLLPNGLRIQAQSRMGWCHDCRNVAPVEHLDSSLAQDEVNERKEFLSTLKANSAVQVRISRHREQHFTKA